MFILTLKQQQQQKQIAIKTLKQWKKDKCKSL